MKIKEITVSLGRTKQISQFEPLNYHVSYKIELADDEDARKETIKLRRAIEKEVTAYFKLIESKGKIVQTVERGEYTCNQSGCGKYIWDDDQLKLSIKKLGHPYCSDCMADIIDQASAKTNFNS